MMFIFIILIVLPIITYSALWYTMTNRVKNIRQRDDIC